MNFDLVEDGTIDFLDFAVFASGWAQPVLASGQARAMGPTGEVVIRAAGKDGVTFTSGEGAGAVLVGVLEVSPPS